MSLPGLESFSKFLNWFIIGKDLLIGYYSKTNSYKTSELLDTRAKSHPPISCRQIDVDIKFYIFVPYKSQPMSLHR